MSWNKSLTTLCVVMAAALPRVALAHDGHPEFPTHESAHALMALGVLAAIAVIGGAIFAVTRLLRKAANHDPAAAPAPAPSRRTT